MSYNFNEEDKVKNNWWKKDKVGDKIQGTYIDRKIVFNQLSGKEQNIYILKLENGEIWNVGGGNIDNVTKKVAAIDSQMQYIRKGQIVEFRYVEERPSKRTGMDPTKIVQVYANKDVVDKEWLDNNMIENVQETFGPVTPAGEVDINKIDLGGNKPAVSAEDELLNTIGELAMKKLAVSDPSQIELAIAKATKLALIPENYEDIVAKLKTL